MNATHKTKLSARMKPFILTAIILVLDQVSKALIVKLVPQGTIAGEYFGDFLWIVHVRNKAIAFSLGQGLPDAVKNVVFLIVPLLVMGLLAISLVRVPSLFSKGQRWLVAGIVGGGFGNLIDRIFRPDGVVDFVSVKFYGLFGLERWPTFNVADSAVVVCGILLLISLIIEAIRHKDPKTPSDTGVDYEE